MLNDTQGAQRVVDFVQDSITEMDARVLFAALVSSAAAIGAKLIAANIYAPAVVCAHFEEGKTVALEPVAAPAVHVFDTETASRPN